MEFRSLGLGLQTPSLSSGLRVSAFGSHKQGFGVRAMISGFTLCYSGLRLRL